MSKEYNEITELVLTLSELTTVLQTAEFKASKAHLLADNSSMIMESELEYSGDTLAAITEAVKRTKQLKDIAAAIQNQLAGNKVK